MAETIRGINIKLGLDTTELDTKLSSLNKDLKEQSKDLKAINANLKYDSSNIDLWKEKQSILNQTLAITKQKLVEQNAQLENAKKAVQVGAMSESEFKKLERGVIYSEAEVARLNTELDQTNKKIKSLGNINYSNLAKVGSSLTKYVTLPVVAAGTALSALTIKTANTVDEINDNAKKLGISVEALQKYEYAAKLLGSSTEDMDKALSKTNSILGAIASGNGDSVADSLAMIGLSVEDLAGLNTEEAFDKIRNALAGVEDASVRTAVANDFFGEKLGTQLAPVLSATSSEMDSLKDKAEEYGIYTQEEADISGTFNDSLDNLKQSVSALAMSFAATLLPTLEKVINAIREKVIPVVQKLINWWTNLSKGMKVTIGVFLGVVTALGPVLVTVGKLIPVIKTLVTSFTAVKGAVSIMGVAVKASTAGWAALIAIIAVILLQNESFRALLKRVFDMLQEVFLILAKLIDKLISALKPILDEIIEVLNVVIDILVNSLNQILDALMGVVDVVIGLIESLLPIVEQIVNMLIDVLVPVIQLIEMILVPVAEVIKVIIGLMVQIIQVVVELINSVIGVVIEIIQVIVDILGVIIELIVNLLDILIEILEPILEIIIALLEPLFTFIGIIIEIISSLIGVLAPLIETLLTPILYILQVVSTLLEFISPVLEILANVIKTIIMPVLQVLFQILKPILDLLNGIMSAIQWIFDKVGNIFGWIGNLFGWGNSSAATETVSNGGGNTYANSTNDNSTTNNNVTINTSGDVDVDTINKALGGAY